MYHARLVNIGKRNSSNIKFTMTRLASVQFKKTPENVPKVSSPVGSLYAEDHQVAHFFSEEMRLS
jgi:hypothetical protein